MAAFFFETKPVIRGESVFTRIKIGAQQALTTVFSAVDERELQTITSRPFARDS